MKKVTEVEFIGKRRVVIDWVFYYTRASKGAKLPLSVLDEWLSNWELAKKYKVHYNTILNLKRRRKET